MFTDIDPLIVHPEDAILKAMKVLDAGGKQVVLVVDEARRLIATLTDGDVRRGLLSGVALDEPLRKVMWANPITVTVGERPEVIRQIMRSHGIRQVPVLDRDGVPRGLAVFDENEGSGAHDTRVILMAGGLGTRLRPLTEDLPKPMLPVGDKPLLELIIQNFVNQGFHKFNISVNYRREVIQRYFGDGHRFNCEIEYVVEEARMGTAGALSLLPERPPEPFLVMNADLLTSVSFTTMIEHHNAHGALATVGAREYTIEVPFGVIDCEGEQLREIIEKPVHRHLVNAGIYVLSPDTLDYLEPGVPADMPDLFKRLIDGGQCASVFPLREYWLDIGAFSDLERAREEISGVFSH
jgi:dTDP-glucose pyrophosphorylase